MNRILITGATGFVGQAVCAHLQNHGVVVRAALRKKSAVGSWDEQAVVGNIDGATEWRQALNGVDGVIHLAAKVHVMAPTTKSLDEFRQVNIEGTRRLAESAAAAGVKRLVFLSSIKVNGEATLPGQPFTALSVPHPLDPYAQSKFAAEECINKVRTLTGMDTVILRTPLIYGVGAKGNLAILAQWANSAHYLPLGGITNQRSLIGLDSLAGALEIALFHESAAGRLFLTAETPAVSTSQIITALRRGFGRSDRLISMPQRFWRLAAVFPGVAAQVRRLTDSLVIEDPGLRQLGWHPGDPLVGLRAMAAHSRSSRVS